MTTTEVTVVAILSPKPGKRERVIELLTNIVSGVTASEPRTIQYELFTQDDTDDVVLVEKYVDIEARLFHRDQTYFMDSLEAMTTEDLLSKELELRVLKRAAGFSHR